MQKPLNITIPEPCLENWDEMELCASGRFCAACRKTVVDFSVMTDAQILSILGKDKDYSICGNYHISQLDRELVAPAQPRFPIRVWQRAAALALTVHAFFATTLAQTTSGQARIEAGPAHKTPRNTKPITINGTVVEAFTNAPLRNVMVGLAGTDVKITTDTLGHFTLELPAHEDDTITLHVLHQHPGTLIQDRIIVNDSSAAATQQVVMIRHQVPRSPSPYKKGNRRRTIGPVPPVQGK